MIKDFSILHDNELYFRLCEDHATKEKAFAELYSRHSKRVYLYCRRILGNKEQADDVFQETFLSLLNSVDKDREMTNLPAFLLRIARNLSLKAKREQKKIFVPLDEFEFGYNDTQFERTEMTELIAEALDLLPDEYREALVLQAYNGMKYEEIAVFMEVPITTVRNWIVRAKKKMRDIMVQYVENREIS
jgi:RNA polymerase sigma-70 factor, ECF subfamily